jgi:hypothetical protein
MDGTIVNYIMFDAHAWNLLVLLMTLDYHYLSILVTFDFR